MGKYYDEPILWRCIDIDQNGPLMLSDRIIMIKAFDAGGIHKYADGTLQADISIGGRLKYGSNLWETSNLRAWLNSTASAGGVVWPDGCPPTKENLRDDTSSEYANDYVNEKGFLATGNFTLSERRIVKDVIQRVTLNKNDEAKLADGGTESLNFSGAGYKDSSLSDVIYNYDTAFYQNVADKMFVLDIRQMYNLSSKSNVLGKNYHIGKPTQMLIDKSRFKDTVFLSVNKCWCNWLRTPFPLKTNVTWVWIAGSPGVPPTDPALNIFENNAIIGSSGVFFDSANDFYIGVRPAFYINLTTGIFTDGYGNLVSPYIVRK
jgi:hypothetical protein